MIYFKRANTIQELELISEPRTGNASKKLQQPDQNRQSNLSQFKNRTQNSQI